MKVDFKGGRNRLFGGPWSWWWYMLIFPLWTQCKCKVIVKIIEFIVPFKRCSLKLFWEAIRVYVSLSICVSPRKLCQIKFLNF